MKRRMFPLVIAALFGWILSGYGDPVAAPQPVAQATQAGLAKPAQSAPAAVAKPHRTFITIQRYNLENTGEPESPIANVRLEIQFPNGANFALPEAGQYWPIQNGQVQEINRTFELPHQYVANDAFKFRIQIVRKGSTFLPCDFDVVQVSQFNRTYVCRTDLAQQKVAAERMDKEGVQVRVFTDLNSPPKELPTNSLALK